jgi:hypothetical protein
VFILLQGRIALYYRFDDINNEFSHELAPFASLSAEGAEAVAKQQLKERHIFFVASSECDFLVFNELHLDRLLKVST